MLSKLESKEDVKKLRKNAVSTVLTINSGRKDLQGIRSRRSAFSIRTVKFKGQAALCRRARVPETHLAVGIESDRGNGVYDRPIGQLCSQLLFKAVKTLRGMAKLCRNHAERIEFQNE